jgi:antitoxin HicB
MSNNFKYPVKIKADDNGTFLVTFLDIPEAITFGDTKKEALERAVECLDTALAFRIKEGEKIPKPSSPKKHPVVFPSALVSLKSALYIEMKNQGLRKSDLARKLECSPKIIDRIVDAKHKSTFAQMEAAFHVMGKHIVINIEAAS